MAHDHPGESHAAADTVNGKRANGNGSKNGHAAGNGDAVKPAPAQKQQQQPQPPQPQPQPKAVAAKTTSAGGKAHAGAARGEAATAQPQPHYTIPLVVQFTTYVGYAVLMLFCYMREAWRKIFPSARRPCPPGYAPLVRDFDDVYTRRLYYRIRDCWNRPIDTRPGRHIGVMERVSKDNNLTFSFTGRSLPAINLASYNYLGFSEDIPIVTANNIVALDRYGVSMCAGPAEGGRTDLLRDLERKTAEYVGKEDALSFAMGFGTNFGGMPSLFMADSLVLSDSLNHASIVAGARVSTCKIKVFPHQRTDILEKIIRSSIVHGQPRTRRPWKRIIIVVEGIYSMEGEVVDLAEVVRIKKKYNCLLYVDEAHSIGAMGVTGRGVCQHAGVDPKDVDVLMGTYTKSFGSIGGYIAGDAALIRYLRRQSSAYLVCEALSGAAAQQALSSLRVILGEDGTDIGRNKIAQLHENAAYFRRGLRKLGMTVFGEETSPVIPAMLYNPAKMPAFSRKLLKRGLGVVVVGYPATSLIESRARFCVSAAHTREDLDHALRAIDEVAGEAMTRYERSAYFL
jgi:serine palmitoyltransferase